MTATTWGDLTAEHVGRELTFVFPWDTDPTTTTLLEYSGLVGIAYDADGGQWPANRLVLDLWGGPNDVQLDNRLPVDVGDADAPPSPETTPQEATT